MTTPPIRLVPLEGIPAIGPGDDLAALLHRAARARGLRLADGVLVVAPEDRVEGGGPRRPARGRRTVRRGEARSRPQDRKDPRHVEVVMRETARVVRHAHGVWIAETRHGFVCANAGVDLSNAPGTDHAVLLPEDPDASARRIRDALVAAGDGPLGGHRLRHLRASLARRTRRRRARLRRHRAALGLARPHRSGRPHAGSHQHGDRRSARGRRRAC